MNITLISDTHTNHNDLNNSLIGGDVLIHSGDVSSRGNLEEISDFIKWFNSIDSYKQKIFIAGNHDYLFQNNPKQTTELLHNNPNIIYLQDNHTFLVGGDNIKVWGTPWQPEFNSWAFNLKRGGDEIKKKCPKYQKILIYSSLTDHLLGGWIGLLELIKMLVLWSYLKDLRLLNLKYMFLDTYTKVTVIHLMVLHTT